ncbi:MAG: DUF4082 domain-containing protein, partial [Actinobacteria bacterium]|nr:DUF4082 domain-containing protein [Actinomycetota bacterium]
PTRSGYTFQGWSASDGGSAVEFPYSPGVTSDMTLYALWSADGHTVTFNSKGGSSVENGLFYTGESLGIPYDPTRAGYSFLGWSATDGGEAVSFPYAPGVLTDVTLYAKWSADSHTVSFNSKGGTAVSAGSFVTDGSFTAPSAPTRAGYTFQGWSASDGGSAVDFPYSPSATTDVTLYAKWSANSHVVTFNSKGGSAVSTGSFVTAGSLAAPSAPTRAGYSFLGWSATDGGSAVSFPYSPGVLTDVTLYAKWSVDSHTITFNSKGGTAVSPGSFKTGESFGSITNLLVDYTPEPVRYQDPWWYGQSVNNGVQVSTNQGGFVRQVSFFKYVDDNGGHSAQVWSADGTLLASQAFAGETSSGWQTVILKRPVFIAANQSFTVSVFGATYAWNYNYFAETRRGPLTVLESYYQEADSPQYPEIFGGTNYGIDFQFEASSSSAPTRPRYKFEGWSATDGGNAISFPYSPGVTTDITLYAVWSVDSHAVTFNSKGGSSVDAGLFYTGESLEIPYDPTRPGYTFLGWSATDGGEAVSFPYAPGVTEDITLYAKWS